MFTRIASLISAASGKPATFIIVVLVVVLWAVTGPIFQYSDTWQLIINTGTTIVTFLMVFLIQNSQNRDSLAVQVKLDELIHAGDKARDEFVHIEDKPEEEIEGIREDRLG